MKKLSMATGIAIQRLNEIDAVIRRISDSRLIDGGAAILAHVNRNHHIVRIGRLAISPFDKDRLRVWVSS